MQFTRLALSGVVEILIDKLNDKRGYFARLWCEQEAKQHKLCPRMVQQSLSHNNIAGTVRGMHYQSAELMQHRTMQAVKGVAHVVMVDIRHDSPTFLQLITYQLNAKSLNILYIPPGIAAGYQTLEDNTRVLYGMSAFYNPRYERGFRWNDPSFAVKWPIPITMINKRDKEYPNFDINECNSFNSNM